MTDERHGTTAFIAAMIERDVLKFGDFVLKSGRPSPYFFNLGAVADGAGLDLLGHAYAREAQRLPTQPEVLFGPAYKGIPIAVGAVTALARSFGELAVGAAFDRKEAKAHGEGGRLIGASMRGKNVAIVDDVVTDGTAKREAFETIAGAGGKVVGVVLALDRQEPVAGGKATAVEALEREFGVPVRCIARVDDVLAFLAARPRFATEHERMRQYRQGLLRELRGPRDADAGNEQHDGKHDERCGESATGVN